MKFLDFLFRDDPTYRIYDDQGAYGRDVNYFQQQNLNTYFEIRVRDRALALSRERGFHPAQNLMPLINLVRDAEMMGLDVSWKPPAQEETK